MILWYYSSHSEPSQKLEPFKVTKNKAKNVININFSCFYLFFLSLKCKINLLSYRNFISIIMNYSHCKAVYLAYFHTLFYQKKTTCFVVDLYKKLKRYTKTWRWHIHKDLLSIIYEYRSSINYGWTWVPEGTSTQATSEFIECKHWMCRKIKTTVFFMWPASWSNYISSFYYSDINLFLIHYACCKHAIYGCPYLRATPGVINIQEVHTEGKELLQLSLKIGPLMTIWKDRLKT